MSEQFPHTPPKLEQDPTPIGWSNNGKINIAAI